MGLAILRSSHSFSRLSPAIQKNSTLSPPRYVTGAYLLRLLGEAGR